MSLLDGELVHRDDAHVAQTRSARVRAPDADDRCASRCSSSGHRRPPTCRIDMTLHSLATLAGQAHRHPRVRLQPRSDARAWGRTPGTSQPYAAAPPTPPATSKIGRSLTQRSSLSWIAAARTPAATATASGAADDRLQPNHAPQDTASALLALGFDLIAYPASQPVNTLACGHSCPPALDASTTSS